MLPRTLFQCGCWIISLGIVAFAESNPYQQMFEDYAAKIRIFEAGELFLDRSVNVCGQPCAAAAQFQIEIKAKPPDPEHLLKLLSHSDARVRTLALAALIDQEDSRFLPQMHALVTDRAATFPGLQPTANAAVVELEQSVGRIASLFTSSYSPDTWKEDQQRGYSAAWFRFKLARASQSTSPIRPDRISRIREVRRQIDLVPQPDRAWILLSLHDEAHADADPLVSESELVAQLNSLGHEARLHLLRKETISSDRSLWSEPSNNYIYHRMCLFVLRHARELLLTEDADFLLAREQWERRHREFGIVDPLISAWWAMAGAELRPANAESILTAAWLRFGDKYEDGERAGLMLALWRLVGERRLPLLADWFYSDDAFSGFAKGREGFLGALTQTPLPKNVALLRTLIADPRLDRLGWRELESLIRLANANSPQPLVTESGLQDVQFVWMDFRYADLSRAEKEAPDQTRKLLSQLGEWRRILRKSFTR